MLSFQRLDVYRCAVDFVTVGLQIAGNLPRGHSELKEQLRRAAISVPLNVAEGAGRTSPPDASRHYAIARGSAMECAAILDIARALGVTSDEQYQSAMELLARLVAMLTKMCR
jgi:four helix bundle protein